MIERQQIAEALGRLDPREREILDYSLRRRVPDEDLAALFGTEPAEVARRRAAAIETLSSDLGAQRGADLGHILKELLEADTWAAVEAPPAAPGEAAQASPRPPEATAPDHPPLGASASAAGDRRDPRGRARRLRARAGHARRRTGAARRTPPPSPSPPSAAGAAGALLIGVAAAAAVLVPAGMVAALATGGDSDDEPAGSASSGTREFSPPRRGPARPSRSPPTPRAPSSTRRPASTSAPRSTASRAARCACGSRRRPSGTRPAS